MLDSCGVGGVLVVIAVPLLDKLKIDDVVGAVSQSIWCAGIWGTIGSAAGPTTGASSFGTAASWASLPSAPSW